MHRRQFSPTPVWSYHPTLVKITIGENLKQTQTPTQILKTKERTVKSHA